VNRSQLQNPELKAYIQNLNQNGLFDYFFLLLHLKKALLNSHLKVFNLKPQNSLLITFLKEFQTLNFNNFIKKNSITLVLHLFRDDQNYFVNLI
jgi:hypothetical protein